MQSIVLGCLLAAFFLAATFLFRRRRAPVVGLQSAFALVTATICCVALVDAARDLSAAGEEPAPKAADGGAPDKAAGGEAPDTEAPPADAGERKLVKPDNWPKGHPLPTVASNCAACHLTAGRELTAAVVHFVRSVHDLNGLTCYDCHGGNSENDVKAHEEEFGFIGTKISAHIKVCSECHDGPVETLAAGPHHWDFSKRINLQYPTCVDCHGNHDVGRPPADFKLTDMCLDCHHTLDKDYPHIASIVAGHDKLSATLRDVYARTVEMDDPVPEDFREPLTQLKSDTMEIVHASKEVPAETARELNGRAEKIRTGLQNWLKSAD